MNALILDSNAIIDLFNGVGNTLEWLNKAEHVAIPSIVVGEVLAGIEPTRRGAETREALDRFLSLQRLSVLPITQKTALFYANIFRQLKRKGTPIPDSDMWIAACALEVGAAICTSDNHFNMLDNIPKVPAR